MTAPAAVSRAARHGALDLDGTPMAFMGANRAAGLLSIMAVGEMVADKLPGTPNRTDAGPLLARIAAGGLCGACVCAAGRESLATGALLGGLGAAIGTFGGYALRTGLVNSLHLPDLMVALPEDLTAAALARGIVSDHG
jgi:uncharacterized membrane protein